MRVSVFGLGYVGCVTSACLARAGHEVVGVDVNRDKVAMINAGALAHRRAGPRRSPRRGRPRGTVPGHDSTAGGGARRRTSR